MSLSIARRTYADLYGPTKGDRIRLADSQKIVAIARLSDGSFWSASADVVVTLAACTEELI